MPLTLGFVVLGLILITWIYTLYVGWRVSQGVVLTPIKAVPFTERIAVLSRLIRRAWYGVGMETNQVLKWSGKKAETAIVTVFPKSAPAFAKHDELTGLTQGPSSYFLKSISVPKKTPAKRLPQTKKVV